MRKGTGSQLLSDSDAPAEVCRAARESPKPLPGGGGVVNPHTHPGGWGVPTTSPTPTRLPALGVDGRTPPWGGSWQE